MGELNICETEGSQVAKFQNYQIWQNSTSVKEECMGSVFRQKSDFSHEDGGQQIPPKPCTSHRTNCIPKHSQQIIIQIQVPYLWRLYARQLSWDVPVKASFIYNKDSALIDTIKAHCMFCITDTQTCGTKWKITPLILNIIFLHTPYNTQLRAAQQKKVAGGSAPFLFNIYDNNKDCITQFTTFVHK